VSRLARQRLLIAAVGVACLAALGLLVGDDATVEDGYRAAGDSDVSIGTAEGRSWRQLEPASGSSRPGFPPPAVSTSEGWCFGFTRLDFDGPPRPSVARCVAPDEVPDLAPDEMYPAIQVRAGRDVWHLVAFGRPIDDVAVTLADGTDLEPSRIHLDERVAALRLSAGAPVDNFEWADGRIRFRCTDVEPVATVTGHFCPTRPPD
jgi:hypothetical protein